MSYLITHLGSGLGTRLVVFTPSMMYLCYHGNQQSHKSDLFHSVNHHARYWKVIGAVEQKWSGVCQCSERVHGCLVLLRNWML